MQITVSNCDWFNRLFPPDGRQLIYPFLPACLALALSDCFFLMRDQRDSAPGTSGALHLSVVPTDWPTDDLRVIFECALLAFGFVSLWYAIRNRRRRIQEKISQRQRAGK